MNADHESSLMELKRESERSRAAFTGTVDDLRAKVNDTATEFKARISPANIKEEVKDQLRSTSQAWMSSLKKKARDNPLQTAAIGAGLAYPLWNLLRSIPAPIMLVGAGFVLAQQKWPGSTEEELTSRVKEQTSDVASAIHDAAIGGVQSLSHAAAEAKAAVSSGAHSLMDKVTDVANDATKTASNLGQAVVDKMSTTTENAGRSVSEGKDSAVEFGRNSGDAILDFMRRNPLLVAGAGLAIGAFVAASVPSSDTENQLFGQTSDNLKNQAKRSAAAGVDQAKKIAADVVGEVSVAAVQQGFSPEGLTSAVEGLTAGVKSVADKGLEGALGKDKPAF